MKWNKKGLIFSVDNNHDWMETYTQLPVVDKFDEETLRIYFGTRDKFNRSRIGFIDVDINNPSDIKQISENPISDLGIIGTFDENGMIPTSIINNLGKKYLFYLGFDKGSLVRHNASLGLLISDPNYKNGKFYRYSIAPILSRDRYNPFFVASAFVMKNGLYGFRMWYTRGTGWRKIYNKYEYIYNIQYMSSKSLTEWKSYPTLSLNNKTHHEVVARPWVMKDENNNIYKMFYCYRDIYNFRTDITKSYRIGYAESKLGVEWTRKDNEVGIDISQSGWDSQMICYPYLYIHDDITYMFYNGNTFGKSGIGYAILEE